jgi:coenzyme F420-reducing hydrogenase delta subunit
LENLKGTATKIQIFYCASNSEVANLLQGYGAGDGVKLMPVPCSGKIDILYLAKAFETGVDGVALVICPEGECRYLEGNLRARKRAAAVDAMLAEIGVGVGRLAVIQMKTGGIREVEGELSSFRAHLSVMPAPPAAAAAGKPAQLPLIS